MPLNNNSIDSSTDWPCPELCNMDAQLRCSICSEYFQSPMIIIACLHTFCSLCLRKCLSENVKKCALCRGSITSMSDAKPNKLIESLVITWISVRNKTILDELHNLLAMKKKTELIGQNRNSESESRSKKRKGGVCYANKDESDDSLVFESYTVSKKLVEPAKRSDDDYPTDCYICMKPVLFGNINSHMDSNCFDHSIAKDSYHLYRDTNKYSSTIKAHFLEIVVGDEDLASQIISPRNSSQDIQVNTTTFNNIETIPIIALKFRADTNEIRKRLKQNQLSTFGERWLLEKRYANISITSLNKVRFGEYRNRFNANCDSISPKSVILLRSEMIEWEKSLSQAPRTGMTMGDPKHTFCKSDEQAKESYLKRNATSFKSLIDSIRENKKLASKFIVDQLTVSGDEIDEES